MSKSLQRVRKILSETGSGSEPIEIGTAKTAQQAADLIGCHVDQIVKSIIFRGETSGSVILFLTAGGNKVCPDRAHAAADEKLIKADANLIRAQTGFAIGGVSPVGHLTPPRTYMDPHLLSFDTVWAAAGTPNHVFSIAPDSLETLCEAHVFDFTCNKC